MRQSFGIEAFRQTGEPADVAKHDGHRSRLAAELEPFRMARELLDIMRRHVLREGAADLALTRLRAQVSEQRGEIDEAEDHPRVNRVDQQLQILEGKP